MKFTCHSCGVSYRINDNLAGRQVTCRDCQERQLVESSLQKHFAPRKSHSIYAWFVGLPVGLLFLSWAGCVGYHQYDRWQEKQEEKRQQEEAKEEKRRRQEETRQQQTEASQLAAGEAERRYALERKRLELQAEERKETRAPQQQLEQQRQRVIKEQEAKRQEELARRSQEQEHKRREQNKKANDETVIRNYLNLNVPAASNLAIQVIYDPLRAVSLATELRPNFEGKLYRVAVRSQVPIVSSLGRVENKAISYNIYFFLVDGTIHKWQQSEGGYRTVTICRIIDNYDH